ncbi:glycoside hydrolase family 81 protein [Mollisia scopiformis]|uniref:glucan endo-1,3-beta-D-glucosidase n=1 Tax=Mollisia scopiformis TaxID=149040 RepID=A0A194XNQ1_MOLSC|nr:glycoside hydrolase family 81 protein [Mollisia scopiformis]KUJ21739.1 glycoside hydrolase family 81 protein [Mollisia scopiformis]
MKATGWLTVLQALAVFAVPLQGGHELWKPVQLAPSSVQGSVETATVLPQTNQQTTIHEPTLVTRISQESHESVDWVDSVSVAPTTTFAGTTLAARSAAPLASIPISDEGEHFASVKTSTVVPSVPVRTTPTKSGTAQVLPSLTTAIPHTTGSVITSLVTEGEPTLPPLLSTSISSPTSLLVLAAGATSSKPSSATNKSPLVMGSQNIFQPIATNAPPSAIGTRPDHPVPRLGIQAQSSPIGTNKFYANFFLGSQTAAAWTHPYSVAWSKGGGSSKSWGMSIQHIDASQRVFGPDPNANPAQYFINPIGIQSIVLSAMELGASTTISMDTVTEFSANVNLLQSPGAGPSVTFPLVQGMGFVSGIYTGSTPILQTGVFFRSITKVTTSPKPGVTKYSILLEDGKVWLLYAYSPSGAGLEFTVVNNGLAQATSGFNGIIQIAKSTSSMSEALYDAACGAYPTTTTISGSVNGATGSYTLSFSAAGMLNTDLLMFALPHHIESFDANTASGVTSFTLDTTTKGTATAVVGNSWTMIENLPVAMGFGPYNPSAGNPGSQGSTKFSFSQSTMAAMQAVAQSEISQNMSIQTNLNSMYYSGKALAKFAQIVYAQAALLDNPGLAQAGLNELKQAFALFAQNQQQYPLVYETAWGGIVSTASYVTGNSGVDFGNTYYNDHHFHYGYFILTGAIIGTLDPTWLPANAPYIDALARDIANPSPLDPYFPVSRNMDWYHGHSWAHGLYETFDGKDQESSSEDAMSAYALKMWGFASGNANLEAVGNLQLAVTARAIQNYYLYTNSNVIQPPNFIGNKAAGILFENKIDHTTYFGTNVEYIEGIHMLPLLPCSSLTRTKEFVQEEWDKYFSNGRAATVQGGWRGVLYANLALVNPAAAWQYFTAANFDPSTLDGGASRTWYMAMAAGMGGAQ